MSWHEQEWNELHKRLKVTVEHLEKKEKTRIRTEQHDIRMRLTAYRMVLEEMDEAERYHEDN